jgi:UPF0148 protein
MSENLDKSVSMKNAADLLMKGASLIRDPCDVCRGVQVRTKDKSICVSCGNEKNISKPVISNTSTPESSTSESIAVNKSEFVQTRLQAVRHLIEEKILMLSKEIKYDDDIEIQTRKADLIETYLRILEKVRQLSIN